MDRVVPNDSAPVFPVPRVEHVTNEPDPRTFPLEAEVLKDWRSMQAPVQYAFAAKLQAPVAAPQALPRALERAKPVRLLQRKAS